MAAIGFYRIGIGKNSSLHQTLDWLCGCSRASVEIVLSRKWKKILIFGWTILVEARSSALSIVVLFKKGKCPSVPSADQTVNNNVFFLRKKIKENLLTGRWWGAFWFKVKHSEVSSISKASYKSASAPKCGGEPAGCGERSPARQSSRVRLPLSTNLSLIKLEKKIDSWFWRSQIVIHLCSSPRRIGCGIAVFGLPFC